MSKLLRSLVLACLFAACGVGLYSSGSRVGTITKFSHKGFFWTTWEGSMVLTGAGNALAVSEWDFSIDRDHEHGVTDALLHALATGEKVRLFYHESVTPACTYNTSYWIDSVVVVR